MSIHLRYIFDHRRDGKKGAIPSTESDVASNSATKDRSGDLISLPVVGLYFLVSETSLAIFSLVECHA